MHTLKLEKQKLETLLYPKDIPVINIHDKRVMMHYELSDLFSKWGNGDGDDDFLCSIARAIIDRIEAQGASVEPSSGIHNNYMLEVITCQGKKWNLYDLGIATYDVDSESNYKKILDSLPAVVHDTLVELSINGVTTDEL